MKDQLLPPEQTDLRTPSQVMRLSRLGAMFPTRLSFLRVLIRNLASEGAKVTRPVWNIEAQGIGHAVYSLPLGGHTYSLVALSTPLDNDQRTDRVIATAWDTTYVLYDGIPSRHEISRIAAQAPKQEAGRFTERDLVLSRANKSVRLFQHVVNALRAGRQPDIAEVAKVGYLMRTTAVYGNGKFGIADRALIENRPCLSGAFAAEMLTVWLIRGFTHDLAEHIGGAKLDKTIKRALGIGNATGLGMAPFLVSHPVLLHNWMIARETAIARVRAIQAVTTKEQAQLQALANRAARHLAEWSVPDPDAQMRIAALRQAWTETMATLNAVLAQPYPMDALIRQAEEESEDVQELTVAFCLEPFSDLVDGLADCMCDPLGLRAEPFADTQAVRTAIETHFDWALDIDFNRPEQTFHFWYTSEEKLEPRLGARHTESGAELESPLDIARCIKSLWQDLPSKNEDLPTFRRAYPQHELALRRALTVQNHPYAEIRDNLIAETCKPVDMLRCKLALFGASKFDPKSDLWTRITLAQGAPLACELEDEGADDWWLPVVGS